MRKFSSANSFYNRQRDYSIEAFKKDNLMPRRYVFVLTNLCNLKCTFCFQERKKKHRHRMLQPPAAMDSAWNKSSLLGTCRRLARKTQNSRCSLMDRMNSLNWVVCCASTRRTRIRVRCEFCGNRSKKHRLAVVRRRRLQVEVVLLVAAVAVVVNTVV